MKTIASYIAHNRFGLGARQNEDDISADPRGWIKAQIQRDRPISYGQFRSSADILLDIHKARKWDTGELKTQMRKALREDFAAELTARAQYMVTTNAPFPARMLMFWSNHFTVSNSKPIIGPAVVAYEREAISPHIFGKFSDMLKAVSRHPVMLNYLDNHTSIGENSRVGQRRRAKSGAEKTINENLAREILELHTLGVNGGYTQNDVIELARAISGWSYGSGGGRKTQPHGGFQYKANYHEPGMRVIMGKRYSDTGGKQGLAVLDDLARHPSTAQFIATKLARHFIADNPPQAAIENIAKAFRDSDGDLAAVSYALVDLDAVWAEPIPKVKNHYEFFIAVHRAIGTKKLRPNNFQRPLREFGQLPFTAPSPAGWGDVAADWISPEALMRRIDWVRSLSASYTAMANPEAFLDDIIGPVVSEDTRTWVSRAPSPDNGMALIFSSPEFQRR